MIPLEGVTCEQWLHSVDHRPGAHRVVTVCDSIEAFSRQAYDGAPFDPANHYVPKGDSWSGGTVRQIREMAEGAGWANEAERIMGAVESMSHDRLPNLQAFFDVSGSEVDVGRYLSGEPESMVEYAFTKTGDSVVRLIGTFGWHAGINVEVIVEAATRQLALVESLRQAGYAVELWASAWSRDEPHADATFVRVLDSRQGYDPLMVAFGCGHPGMLRHLNFMIRGQYDEAPRRWGGGASGWQGHPVRVGHDDYPELLERAGLGDALVLPIDNHVKPDGWPDLIEWVEGQRGQ